MILRLKSAEVSSSEFCIEVLIWGNKDLDLLIQAVDRILMRCNCWQALLSNSIQSEFKGETSNSKCLRDVIIPRSSV